ncbi:MAG: TPM domain-containing protein [Lachnospiraceae bacterium]|nr:TPM domain-containing protein [Lachnospiraceae bacterium]
MSVEEFNAKKEARKHYLKYFRGWFVVVAIMLVLSGVVFARNLFGKGERTNDEAPDERVFDYADVLTDEEEEKLTKLIAKSEKKIQADIVLVTIDKSVEGDEAKEKYGYRSYYWDANMQDIADDFYDENMFGYDEEYSGALLLMNWYEDEEGSQRGAHLSTCGKVMDKFSTRKIDQVIDSVANVILSGGSPYKAYKAYVNKTVSLMGIGLPPYAIFLFLLAAAIIPIIVASSFVAVKSISKEGSVTTSSHTYVSERSSNNIIRDEFVRKNVTSRRIPRNTTSTGGGGGGVRSSGGGGRHISSSGRVHGGGSRRF